MFSMSDCMHAVTVWSACSEPVFGMSDWMHAVNACSACMVFYNLNIKGGLQGGEGLSLTILLLLLLLFLPCMQCTWTTAKWDVRQSDVGLGWRGKAKQKNLKDCKKEKVSTITGQLWDSNPGTFDAVPHTSAYRTVCQSSWHLTSKDCINLWHIVLAGCGKSSFLWIGTT